MIFANKQETFRNKVQECGKDTKKLYQLMNNMCGTVKQNPMPETSSELALADSFADYFFQKIVTIRETLKNEKEYSPVGECEGFLSSFEIFSEEEV